MSAPELRVLDLRLWRAALQVASFALRVNPAPGECSRCGSVAPVAALIPSALDPTGQCSPDSDLGFCGECIASDLAETRQQLARALREREAVNGFSHGATG